MNQINIPYKLRVLQSNAEVINELLQIIEEENIKKIVFITSKTPNSLITNSLEIALSDKVEKIKTFQVMDASVARVNQIPAEGFDLVIGVGGGKVLDVAKYTAHINNLPCVSIPTSISNDGICSPIAVLKEKHNRYVSLGSSIPFAMLVPLHLIQNSDEEQLVSGVGDLLSNLTAIEDWRLASKETGEAIDDYAVIIAENASNEVLLLIEKYILLRKTREQFFKNNLKTVINALSLSGIAMEIAGTSRPASGAEHLISHSIDELYGGVKQHGIQVAFGMYLMTYFRFKKGLASKEQFEEIRAVLRYLGIPTTLPTIGLTKEQLVKAILHAPNTRPGRYTYLTKMNLDERELDRLLDELFGPKSKLEGLV